MIQFRVFNTEAKVWVRNVEDFTVESLYDRCPSYHKVMQFTGLFDKNNNPVYEGDIIQFCHEWFCNIDKKVKTTPFEGVCHFNNMCFQISNYSLDSWDKRPEVIGNIYDNSELLKDIND